MAIYAFKDAGDGYYQVEATDENSLPDWAKGLTPCDVIAIQQPPLTPDQIVASYMDAIQAALDAGAQSWGYDDLRAAVSYVGDPYPRFNAEAIALRNWRSAVWVWASMEEAAIKAGNKALPTPVAAFVAQMPAIPERPSV